MNVLVLLSEIAKAGYTIRLEFTNPVRGLVPIPNPQLVKKHPELDSLPPKLLAHIKLHRNLILRHLILVAVEQKAQGKPLWGFNSNRLSCDKKPKKKGFPDDVDRVTFEGCEFWYALPVVYSATVAE